MEVIVFSCEEHISFYSVSMVSPENIHIHVAFYRLSRFYLWIQEKKDTNTDMFLCIYIKKKGKSELKQGGCKSDFGGRKGEEENYIII